MRGAGIGNRGKSRDRLNVSMQPEAVADVDGLAPAPKGKDPSVLTSSESPSGRQPGMLVTVCILCVSFRDTGMVNGRKTATRVATATGS